jgi:hypothetical protein
MLKEDIIDIDSALIFLKCALVKDLEQRILSWHKIQTLLASGKGSRVSLLANTDMDMAVVVKLKTTGINTDLLLKEIQQVLDVCHAS